VRLPMSTLALLEQLRKRTRSNNRDLISTGLALVDQATRSPSSRG
jgi:hypothetical protein